MGRVYVEILRPRTILIFESDKWRNCGHEIFQRLNVTSNSFDIDFEVTGAQSDHVAELMIVTTQGITTSE